MSRRKNPSHLQIRPQFVVTYRSLDGYTETRTYYTLDGARRFAHKWVGALAESSEQFQYAVSWDGIGRITVRGCNIRDLFPQTEE